MMGSDEMSEEAQKLLMMFIRDLYTGSGKPTKITGLKAMAFVRNTPELSKLVNSGSRDIVNYRLKQSEFTASEIAQGLTK